jgi:hypothetical protein
VQILLFSICSALPAPSAVKRFDLAPFGGRGL